MNEPENKPPEVLTRSEVAARLRISDRTVMRYEKSGILRPLALLPGGCARYLKSDIDKLLAPPEVNR